MVPQLATAHCVPESAQAMPPKASDGSCSVPNWTVPPSATVTAAGSTMTLSRGTTTTGGGGGNNVGAVWDGAAEVGTGPVPSPVLVPPPHAANEITRQSALRMLPTVRSGSAGVHEPRLDCCRIRSDRGHILSFPTVGRCHERSIGPAAARPAALRELRARSALG